MPYGLFKTPAARRRRKGLSALLLPALAAAGLAFLPPPSRTARGFDQDQSGLERSARRGDSPAAQVFRQGRDLIEKEDWAGAAAKFEGYVAQYPKGQDADAALYWLAYALKKQRKFPAAEATLERLAAEFPRSTWVDDGRAMQVEIAPQVGKRVDPAALDDEELKIVALQSLFQSDPARAVAFVAEILKPGSRASREFKEAAVSMLGQDDGPEAAGVLLDIARAQPDPELRGIALHRLGQSDDERAVGELMKIYESERDGEVKGRMLRVFSQMNDPRAQARLLEAARGGDNVEVRSQAIHWLGQRRGEATVDELMSIFRADRDEEIRNAVLHSLSQIRGQRARAALLEIARGGDHPRVRSQAIHWLGQLDDAASVEELVRLYDAERDEEVKRGLLHAFSGSKQESALLKLMNVARGDSSGEMRRQAIHWLGQSRDPRALKFIQDLLR